MLSLILALFCNYTIHTQWVKSYFSEINVQAKSDLFLPRTLFITKPPLPYNNILSSNRAVSALKFGIA